ncbi:hypothetical protein ACE38W_13575 [Chitinophaga sp. Hz27]|uniref:hypothetical protein n=1 Tax=Chitinophaga sp. Hz27 TaxID=3347169 RepID=UPI0035DF1284
MLPDDFAYLAKQVNDGLLVRISRKSTVRPNYIGFSYGDVVRKYERKSDNGFLIKGTKVYDTLSNEYIEFNIVVGYGLVLGYFTPNNDKFKLDVDKIDLSDTRILYDKNSDFDKIKKHLTKDQQKQISPDDVYPIELEGTTYYHLKDLEDGDFVGMDEEGNAYQVTHDPYQILPANKILNKLLSADI